MFTKEQSVIEVNVIVKNYMYRSHTGTCRAPVALSVTLNNMKVLYTQVSNTMRVFVGTVGQRADVGAGLVDRFSILTA